MGIPSEPTAAEAEVEFSAPERCQWAAAEVPGAPWAAIPKLTPVRACSLLPQDSPAYDFEERSVVKEQNHICLLGPFPALLAHVPLPSI